MAIQGCRAPNSERAWPLDCFGRKSGLAMTALLRRRRRIASGSGTSVPEINRLLKQYQDMADMMKKMKKLGHKGLARHGLAGLMPGAFRH